jgi:3-oxoacyl-[acyl-carrier-protein] synthase II
MKRRVVITGIGLLTPLGTDIRENLDALTTGRSGITRITRFDASQFATQIAGELKNFDPTAWMSRRDARNMDRFQQLAIAAGADALRDSGLEERFSPEAAERAGCYVGSGWGGLGTLQTTWSTYLAKGPRFGFSPYAVSGSIINLAPGQLAIRHNIQGPTMSHVSACSTGAHAIGEAMRAIQWGICDVVLAGGTEAPIEPLGIGCFGAIRALSLRNDAPEQASRPFDRDRDGFVLSEGACVLVLEEMQRALQRSARIYAEICGYGASTDAHHVTEPAPDGVGAQRCMKFALADAGIAREEIGYINAHGTSTRFNDAVETRAIKGVFQEHARRIAISSTKSMTGHMMGAAGAAETAFSALTLANDCLFPTINYENPDPECDLDYVPNQARQQRVKYVMNNNFGFGGTNACLVLGRVE